MTTTPRLSVITTAFNREAYLSAAMESVLASSFGDFEYIVVDDCSTDATYEVAQSYARQDCRVKLFRNEKNLGDYGNRHKAATLAEGDYLKYVDSDDIIYPHGLDTMMRCMTQFPEAGLGVSRRPSAERHYPYALSPTEAYQAQFLERKGVFDTGPLSAIIRRECYVAIGGFTGVRYLGDAELWLALGRDYPVVLMPDGLTWWRQHDTQEMAYERKSLDAVMPRYCMKVSALEHPDCPLSSDERLEALRILRRQHTNLVLSIARRKSPQRGLSIARALNLGIKDIFGATMARLTGAGTQK